MNFISRFLHFLSGAAGRVAGYQSGSPNTGSLTTKTITTESAMQVSAVFACVRLIAETVAGLPIHLYELSQQADGSARRKLAADHPLAKLLAHKPNRYQTRIEFFETLVMQLALHGNAYCLKQSIRSRLVGLLPLMSAQVQTKLMPGGNVVHEYHSGKDVVVYSEESIWHIKLFGNGIIGLSPMGHAKNSLGIAISAEERVSKMANNGFKPSGVLMIDKVLTKPQREAIRANFADLSEGGEDTLRVLEAGMTYQQVSMNPKDVQFMESRRFQMEDIARFFGVPSVMINDTKATTAWGSGIEQIVQGFYKLTIRPYLERIELSGLVHLMTPDARTRYELAFDFDALLRGDMKTRYETYREAVLNGLKTVNECRAIEGDGPVKGGEKAYMQGQMTPLERLSDPPKPPPALAPPASPDTPDANPAEKGSTDEPPQTP